MRTREKVILMPYSEEEFEAKLKCLLREVLLEEMAQDREVPSGAEEEKPMKIGEVCEFFNVTKPTIYKWIDKGFIKHHKMSNKTFFLKSELMEALREGGLKKRFQ